MLHTPVKVFSVQKTKYFLCGQISLRNAKFNKVVQISLTPGFSKIRLCIVSECNITFKILTLIWPLNSRLKEHLLELIVHKMYSEEILLYTANSRMYDSCLFLLPAWAAWSPVPPRLSALGFVLRVSQGYSEADIMSITVEQFANIKD